MSKKRGTGGGQRGGAIPDCVAPFSRNFRVFSEIYLIKQKGEENRGVRMAEEGTRKKSRRGGQGAELRLFFKMNKYWVVCLYLN